MFMRFSSRNISLTSKFLEKHYLKASKMYQNDGKTYEDAINFLNKVQSNRNNLLASTSRESGKKLELVRKYLIRSGISLNDLNQLPVIHVSGTKGKGSTCAFCESILRHNGYKTGFFSSPHLIEVRERIRINGIPISKETFAKYFWNVVENLHLHKENEADMPFYFQLIFIMSVHVFLRESVDVAIVEVGIGGEYDPTNIVTNVPVAGITSLGFDHTSVLGNTIESIAWNKAGIMKEGTKVFTVSQPKIASDVLHKRSIERKSTLNIVKNECDLNFIRKYPGTIQTNINLAIKMAEEWMVSCPKLNNTHLDQDILKESIEECNWPGRYETQQRGNIRFFIDGAHTVESIDICVKWYLIEIKDREENRALIFNLTGGRSCEKFFMILKKCLFQTVIFVPNIAETSSEKADNINLVLTIGEQLSLCNAYKQKWLNIPSTQEEDVYVKSSVKEAVDYLEQKGRYNVLVTGSLHLVGAILSLLNPDLNRTLETPR